MEESEREERGREKEPVKTYQVNIMYKVNNYREIERERERQRDSVTERERERRRKRGLGGGR